PVPQSFAERNGGQSFQCHGIGVLDFGVDQALDFSRGVAAVYFHVQLEVQPQTAWIQVRRSHVRPGAVDGNELGMVEVSSRPPYPAAAAYDLVQLCRHGVVDEAQVVLARNDDVHRDATPCGGIDGAHE